ncbi:MAG: pyridoxamine 5'-phosphate oxidase family protein [Streptosporangiaceae bacterium]
MTRRDVDNGSLEEIQRQTFTQATELTRTAYPRQNRLSGTQLAAYLQRRSFAVVSSCRPDGRPHAVVTSFAQRGTRFWLPMGAGSVRERNVKGSPWLSLVVTEGDRKRHIAVIIEGLACVAAPSDVPSDLTDELGGAWVGAWLRLDAQRVLSYASDGALP